MDFNIKSGQPEKQTTDCLIFPVFESGKLADSATKFDKHSKNSISKVVGLGDMTGKFGSTLVVYAPIAGIKRMLLIGCGKKSDFDEDKYRQFITVMAKTVNSLGATNACCVLSDLNITGRDLEWQIQQATTAAANSEYDFNTYKSSKAKKDTKPKKLSWLVNGQREEKKATTAVKLGKIIANAMSLTKDLANTPGNICHPTFLAKEAEKVAKAHKKIKCTVLNESDMKTLKMGAFLSVTQGSAQPPKLITLEYTGAAKTNAPIVFVGKGVTFDTGGNSLKPADKMIGMKYDMCGAATVLGLIKFAAEYDLPLNIVGVMAAVENMPGGAASRPDDIVKTMSGQTVEILNTDAEGRLVLCDTLTYCERFNPKVVIDMATLTGACVVALGYHNSALFANNQVLANSLLKAGKASGDKCWQMPLSDDYTRQLDSNFADLANIGNGGDAGSITAACFLSKFTTKYRWAHLDIAGTACKFTGPAKGATGRPLPLLAEYLLDECK